MVHVIITLDIPVAIIFFPRKSTDMDDAVWGWESFFLQLRSFLETSSREIETASEDYSYFVLERLHIAVRNLSHVRNVLESPRMEDISVHVKLSEERYSSWSRLISNLGRPLPLLTMAGTL